MKILFILSSGIQATQQWTVGGELYYSTAFTSILLLPLALHVAHCGIWLVEQCPSIFSYLPPTLSISFYFLFPSFPGSSASSRSSFARLS